MDALAAIMTKVHGLLTADASLQTLMGGTVRLYPNWQPDDTAMPYITQFVDIRDAGEPFPIQKATLTLHLWSDSENATEVTSMRARVIALLDELVWSTDDISKCRTWMFGSGIIPDEPNIWHCVVMFNLRFYRKTEALAIINR